MRVQQRALLWVGMGMRERWWASGLVGRSVPDQGLRIPYGTPWKAPGDPAPGLRFLPIKCRACPDHLTGSVGPSHSSSSGGNRLVDVLAQRREVWPCCHQIFSSLELDSVLLRVF